MGVRICFVCLGNICRSPTAEGVLNKMLSEVAWGAKVDVDSAGTGAWHVGESADRRSAATAQKRGYVLGSKSRQFTGYDFDEFDWVIAMDNQNKRDLMKLAQTDAEKEKIFLFRDFEPEGTKGLDTPDPYYGGATGFDDVLDICERGCRGIMEALAKKMAA